MTPLSTSVIYACTKNACACSPEPYLLCQADAARVLVKGEEALRAKARVVRVVALGAHVQRAALRHAHACIDAKKKCSRKLKFTSFAQIA